LFVESCPALPTHWLVLAGWLFRKIEGVSDEKAKRMAMEVRPAFAAAFH
jgi:hypothetical protein